MSNKKELDKIEFNPDYVISLKQFPPNVRKLAKYILQNEEPVTITEACKRLDLSINTINVQLSRARKKGIDFQEFINRESMALLKKDKLAVNKALLNGAVSGSHNHQKLYYQLTGDLKETQINTSITLAIGINTAAPLAIETDRDKGVIDTEPIIPDKS